MPRVVPTMSCGRCGWAGLPAIRYHDYLCQGVPRRHLAAYCPEGHRIGEWLPQTEWAHLVTVDAPNAQPDASSDPRYRLLGIDGKPNGQTAAGATNCAWCTHRSGPGALFCCVDPTRPIKLLNGGKRCERFVSW